MCTHILESQLLVSWCISDLCLGAGVSYQALSSVIPEVQGNPPRSVCALPFMAFNYKSIELPPPPHEKDFTVILIQV